MLASLIAYIFTAPMLPCSHAPIGTPCGRTPAGKQKQKFWAKHNRRLEVSPFFGVATTTKIRSIIYCCSGIRQNS